MKQLFLIRHAKSDWSTRLSDYYRPLNNRGLGDAPKMGKRIHGLFGCPDIIISSGAKRAFHTAELFAKELGFDVKKIHQNDQLYHASTQEIIEVVQGIDEQFETAMLFSHNPGISQTVYELTDHYIDLKTGCVVGVNKETGSWQDFRPGKCHIFTHLSPKDNLN